MKKTLWALILISFCLGEICTAGELPISGLGVKPSESISVPVQPQFVCTYPYCFWNGRGWVYKQKSKVNYKRKGQEQYKTDDYYSDYIGNNHIYIQDRYIYNISPNCYYKGTDWVCSHKSKANYSHENGK